MAETMPTQTSPEQSLLASEATSIKEALSKASTFASTPEADDAQPLAPEAGVGAAESLPVTTAEQINEQPPAEDVDVGNTNNGNEALPVTTAEKINGTEPTMTEDTASAPMQTTTGEPNGTNGQTNKTTDTISEDDEETPLFSADLISPEVAAVLPDGYIMRPLRRSDYHRGFLDTLRVLTTVGEPTYASFSSHFHTMAHMPLPTYHTLVIIDPSLPPATSIVGTGSVLVERKFIHNMGLVGHIEDIAVAKNQQGKKLGLRIIQALDYVAEKVGCYKCILDCSEANEGFYVKCGFKRAGLEMAHYYGR